MGGISLVFKLIPREEKFFDYFKSLSDLIYEAAFTIDNFFINPEESSEKLSEIDELEKRGEAILSLVINKLNSSFITPFDREDILLISRLLNSSISHFRGIIQKYVIYRVKTLDRSKKNLQEINGILVQSAIKIKQAVILLPNIRDKNDEIMMLAYEILLYQHQGHCLCRESMGFLFAGNYNVVDVIKWKEIYRQLENALDSYENLGNIIREVAVKYV